MQVKVGHNENQAINTNIQTQEKAATENGRKAAKQQRKATIFAGELPLHKDSITLRRQQAQKKAMEFVKNAWSTDRKTDQSMEEYRTLADGKREELRINRDRIAECRDRKEKLREGYGVEADSQEQKDLEFLERMYSGEFAWGISEEDQQRLAELEGQPLTEYQQKCLEIDGEEKIFKIRAGNAESAIETYNGAVTDMKIERLKYHKMTDAQNNAQKVMEQASEDIQGMLIEEAKDHVEETYEETREEAEKKAEEKEAEEEKIELRKEQKELMEARIDAVREESHEAEETQRDQEKDAREEAALLKDMAEAGLDVAGSGATVKAEIKDMLNKMKLIEADIKGIEVDEEI